LSNQLAGSGSNAKPLTTKGTKDFLKAKASRQKTFVNLRGLGGFGLLSEPIVNANQASTE